MSNIPEISKAPVQPSNMNPNQNVGLSPQQINMANKTGQALAPDNQQISEFVNNLLVAMLGVQLTDIVEDKREEMVKKCLGMFNDFIIGYFDENYTPVDTIRLKAAQAYPESGVFEKFPDQIGRAHV